MRANVPRKSRMARASTMAFLGSLFGGCVRPDVRPAAPLPTVVVRAQSPDEAFEWLEQQLDQMPFFREHHYDVALPAQPLPVDKNDAHRVFAREVYDAHAFDRGLASIERVRPALASELATFERWKRWGFVRPNRYEIVLTLYGPGGSYDPERARITVLTTPDGRFRKEPLENLVHEMVHMGST
jgi:hypothetical protein